MTDEMFAEELVRLEAQGDDGKQGMWRHIKENGGMKRVAALVRCGADRQRPKKKKAPNGAGLPALLDGPSVVSIPLVDKTEFGVTMVLVKDYAATYPAVDVEQELRAMRRWCVDNPRLCKTRTGIMRFMNSWLARAQNNSGGGGRPANGAARNGSAHDSMMAGAAMFLTRDA